MHLVAENACAVPGEDMATPRWAQRWKYASMESLAESYMYYSIDRIPSRISFFLLK